MVWYRDETVTFVEFHCILILGLDNNDYGRYRSRCFQCLTKGVHKQEFTDSLALQINMPRKATDQRSRKARVLWNPEVLEEFLRQVACIHSVLRQCVIARDGDPIWRQNEYRRDVLLHILRSLLLDVLGEGVMFARKSRPIVFLSIERLRFKLRCQSANLAPVPPNRSHSCVVGRGRVHERLNESPPLTLRQSQNLVFLDDFVGRVSDGSSHQVRDRDAAQTRRCLDHAFFFLRDPCIQSFRPLCDCCSCRHRSCHLRLTVYGRLPHIARYLCGKSTHTVAFNIYHDFSKLAAASV
jgi:hypothetical protein